MDGQLRNMTSVYITRYVEPKCAEPKYADPKYADSKYVDPKYARSKCADSKYAESKYAKPKCADSKYAESKYAKLKCADSKCTEQESIEQNHREMLLLYRIGSRVVAPSWCGIGGHFEAPELNDARAAALRELEEEIHLTEDSLKQLQLRYVTMRLKNGEIRQNYYFFAELKDGVSVDLRCDEGICEWVPYEDVMKRKMPYTAKFVVEHYLEKGRENADLYAGIAHPGGVLFQVMEEFE